MTSIVNPGNVATDRWTLTLTPSASVIKVVNAAENEPPMVLQGVTASEVVIDGFNHNVWADGVYAYQLLAPGSGWFFIQPGGNSITITGATGSISFLPAYL